MDIKELPLVLFREFSIATFEEADGRTVGETPEGLGLLVARRNHSFEVIEFSVHRSPQHIPDDSPFLTVVAGTHCTNDSYSSVERIQEKARVEFPVGFHRLLDLTKPHALVIARIMLRAVELTQSGAYELGWFWFDWKTQQRVTSPYGA